MAMLSTLEVSQTDDAQTREPLPAATNQPLANLNRDILLHASSAILSSVAMLALNLIAIRVIGRAEYGSFASLQTVAQWWVLVFCFGGPLTLTMLGGHSRHAEKSTALGIVYCYLALVCSGAAAAALVERSTGWFGIAEVSQSALVAVVTYAALMAFFELLGGLLRGADRFGQASLLSTAQSLLLAIGATAGAFLFRDANAALWGANLGMLTVFVVASVSAIRAWGVSCRNIRQVWNTGMSAGARSYLVNIFEVGAETFGILYLFGISDLRGAAAVVACQRVCTTLSKPAAIISQVLVGKVAGQSNDARAAIITLKVAQVTFTFAALGFLVVLPFLAQFTQWTLGPEFSDATPLMLLFMLSAVFRGHASAAVGILLGQGCPRSYMLLKLLVLLTAVAITLVMYPAHGSLAVGEAYLATSVILVIGISAAVVRQAGSIWALVTGIHWQHVVRLLGVRSRISSS